MTDASESPAADATAASRQTAAAPDAANAGHRNPAAETRVVPWYKNAVIYELHVRAFHDSNSDGIGDFRGLTEKLDYLQELGVTAIWLLPFYPSPLRDDGYDIAEYTGVHPAYGTLSDARRFIREAHRRGLRVITELVLNHTSDQHPWFQRARRSPPGSRQRDFYVWSDTAERYPEARVIFSDFESSNWSWDPVAKAYFWHRFYSHQPDLNFENPDVQVALQRVVDFWLAAGVDGLRLDAVPYLFERDGTNCENLPETHEYLKRLRHHVDRKYGGDRMLLAEANQWPEDAVAYFGDGDESHMSFHFPLMPRLFMALRMEDRFPILDILDQTPAIHADCQWAIFLRNHDELTLEMVTDEERDYMYRVYAQDRRARINLGIRRRLAPLLEGSRRKIELMNGLLFSMPGSPVIYYGDEIGMGDNFYLGDRNAVRTPMQWSSDRNAGFSRANPQQLYLPVIIDPEYNCEAINVEAQQRNPTSLLWWMRRLITLRRRHQVFGSGSLEVLTPSNHRVVAFLRRDADDTVLVVANLSRFVQAVELDLKELRGATPVELFGHTRFPAIGDLPYFLTLGPHGFYWFALERAPAEAETATWAGAGVTATPPAAPPPLVEVSGGPARLLLDPDAEARLARVLQDDLPKRRWFRAKARTARSTRLRDLVPVPLDVPEREAVGLVALAEVQYSEGEPETYAIPLVAASPAHSARVVSVDDAAIVARLRFGNSRDSRAGAEPSARGEPRADAREHGDGSRRDQADSGRGDAESWILYDGLVDPAFGRALFDLLARRRQWQGRGGRIVGSAVAAVRHEPTDDLAVRVVGAEQTNSSIVYDGRWILKLYRGVAPGPNPDIELTRHLSERARFEHVPAYAGSIEYRSDDGERWSLALLQEFVAHQSDGWRYTLDTLSRFYERMLAAGSPAEAEELIRPPFLSVLRLLDVEPRQEVQGLLGHYRGAAALLGQRTAEMHAALASSDGDQELAPEPLGQLSQRSLYQSSRNTARRALQLLRQRLDHLPESARADAVALLEREGELLTRLRRTVETRLGGRRIRCHGDFHLGQVLWTGRDFVILDFEGEPARSATERRL
ncbi:MAG TPA: maltose alpha-D-glucosyltransferase, partial [Thermoanaerobaculia bacterium]|nr:maltose alpha-D-glucosyltransferase [Thermoanaerobaculia bacterium]